MSKNLHKNHDASLDALSHALSHALSSHDYDANPTSILISIGTDSMAIKNKVVEFFELKNGLTSKPIVVHTKQDKSTLSHSNPQARALNHPAQNNFSATDLAILDIHFKKNKADAVMEISGRNLTIKMYSKDSIYNEVQVTEIIKMIKKTAANIEPAGKSMLNISGLVNTPSGFQHEILMQLHTIDAFDHVFVSLDPEQVSLIPVQLSNKAKIFNAEHHLDIPLAGLSSHLLNQHRQYKDSLTDSKDTTVTSLALK